jgi:hypothetical protein
MCCILLWPSFTTEIYMQIQMLTLVENFIVAIIIKMKRVKEDN